MIAGRFVLFCLQLAIELLILDTLQYCGEFDNWGAIMSVSDELVCSFELLQPLDSTALKRHIKKTGKNRVVSYFKS